MCSNLKDSKGKSISVMVSCPLVAQTEDPTDPIRKSDTVSQTGLLIYSVGLGSGNIQTGRVGYRMRPNPTRHVHTPNQPTRIIANHQPPKVSPSEKGYSALLISIHTR